MWAAIRPRDTRVKNNDIIDSNCSHVVITEYVWELLPQATQYTNLTCTDCPQKSHFLMNSYFALKSGVFQILPQKKGGFVRKGHKLLR